MQCVPSLRIEVELLLRVALLRRRLRQQESNYGRVAEAGGDAEGGVAGLVGGGQVGAEARQGDHRLQLILGGSHVQRSVAVSVLRE